jgi:hypothetical protein
MGPKSYLQKRLHQIILGMKKFNYYSYVLLIAALACAGISGCQTSSTAAPGATGSVTAPATHGGAQLVIRRAANMGTGLFLDVTIDGARVGALAPGETYRGALSPGQHTVAVILRPNQLNLPPTRKTFTVAQGQTVRLTASWQGQTVVLL